MTLDISLILRKWAFDLDSEALGPIRIAKADMQKIFNENKAAIRAGELKGAQLARLLFEKMAHERTGDEAIDKTCDGPTFESSELDLLTISELDLFADKLMKERLGFVEAKGAAERESTTETGCAALSGALIAFADDARASRAALAETIKKEMFGAASFTKHLSTADQIEVQWKKSQSIAAAEAGLTATSIADAERARVEDQWRSMSATESVADKPIKDWKHQDDKVRAAMGHVNDGGVAKALEQYERDQKQTAIAMGTIQGDMRGFTGMSASERIGMASGSAGTIAQYIREKNLATTDHSSLLDSFAEPEITIPEIRAIPAFHQLPNPAYETNKIVSALLVHQKEESAKKDAESVTAHATSSSGLRYTKAMFWCAVVVAILSIGTTFWVYFDQQAGAADSAKAAAAESAMQRAEIRELTAALRKSIESKSSVDQVGKPRRTK